MPNRILKESICTSDSINNLAPEEEVFFYRLIVNCDDYGRFDGRTSILRSKCFPLKIDRIDDKTIARWIKSLVSENLVKIYVADDGKEYLEIASWEKHQQIRTKKSKYPEPAKYIHFEESSYAQLITETADKTAYTNECYKQTQSIDNNCRQLISNDINTKQQKQSDIKCNQLISNDSRCQQLISNDVLNPNPNTNPNINNKSVIANAITPRTGSDERTCVTEEHRTSTTTTTQEKKLEGEQGMAVTSEPEQTTETAGQPETDNDALITTGEDELEQLLEEFFEDVGEPAENQDTAKTMEPLVATGEGESEESSVPVEVPEDHETARSRERLNTTGVELENSKECNTVPQDQATSRTQDHLTVLREEDEIELLGRFFEGGSVQYATAVSNAEVKDATTVCTTVAESMDNKVAELADFVQGFIEDFKQELETPPVLEPVTQDKLEEISQILQQNRMECKKRETPATNDDDFQEEEKEIQELTNQKLIARLVGKYRRATGMKSKDDFPRIGHLYLEFNYAVVEQAIEIVGKRIKQNVEIKDPLAYLYKVCEGIEKKIAERHEKHKKYKKGENKGRHYSLINLSPEVLEIVEGGSQNDL